MQKIADTDYPVHDLIARRWSPVIFSSRPVEAEALLSCLEAARWAPSSYNEQPWRFIVARREDEAEFEKLLACLVEPNQQWARMAPTLMLTAARMRFARNDKDNRHAFHDVGLAVENLVIQATDLGLAVHQMAGFYADKARETYDIPEEFEAVAAMAIGYPGEPEATNDEKLKARDQSPRERMPLSELVFESTWDKKANLIPR